MPFDHDDHPAARRRAAAGPVAEPLEPRRLLASAELLRDLDPRNASSATAAPFVVSAGGAAYFTPAAAGGEEVWRTDGTAAGTYRVKDIVPGYEGSVPQHLTDAGGTLFFAARTPAQGRELWRSDGTADGTVMVKDLAAGAGDGFPGGGNAPAALGSRVLFVGGLPSQLWVSDGTDAGTLPVPTGRTLGAGTIPRSLKVVGGQVFFLMNDARGAGEELWRTDGTAAGTRLVKDVRPGTAGSSINGMTVAGDRLYFIADDGVHGPELWRSDGTAAGTLLVRDLTAGAAGTTFANLAGAADGLYFSAAADPQLWWTGGDAASTVRVATLPGPASAVTPVAGGRVFCAVSANFESRLWVVDRSAGTAAVVNDVAGRRLTLPLAPALLAAGDRVYFYGITAGTGGELWVTDGTVATSARLVAEVVPGPASGAPLALAPLGNQILFTADDGLTGREPWVTDGTAAAGARRVRDINTAPLSASPMWLARAGSRVFFYNYNTPLAGLSGLWATDGTPGGTARVKDVDVRLVSTADLDGTLYFESRDEYGTPILYRSDGTAAGTGPVTPPGTARYPRSLTTVGGQVFYVAEERVGGEAFYTLSATDNRSTAGRPLLNWPTGGSVPREVDRFFGVGGICYFPAASAADGEELWRSDGTAAGTYRLTDLAPGAGSAYPNQFGRIGDDLLFTAFSAAGLGLYRSRGAPGDAVLVKPLEGSSGPPFGGPFLRGNAYALGGGVLVFNAEGGALWRTDGTVDGTYLLRAAHTPLGFTNPKNAAVVNGRLFFAASQYVTGTVGTGLELWTTDGTVAGTRLVADLEPGVESSQPAHLCASGGLLYFQAYVGGVFRLWQSDGTAAGTVPVTWPEPAGPGVGSNPAYLVDLDGTLVLNGSNSVHGSELWRVPGNTTSVVGRFTFYNDSYFDGNDPAAGPADDAAVATDKPALFPGQTAAFKNYTSYSRGLNGIMVDIAGLPAGTSVSAADFEFRAGNAADAGSWAAAPAPASVTVRRGAGAGGSDRVTLTWADATAVRGKWLRVTVLPTARTGLAAADVFHFGNAPGESGDDPTHTYVDGTDFAGARDNGRNFLNRAPIDFRWDYDRDSFVDGSDLAIARDSNTNFLTALKLIAV